MATKNSTPSWRDVKTNLADYDRIGLIGLVQDLYAASKDNQALLHARFALDSDVLKPYMTVIARLDSVRHISHNFGYGVGDDMDDLLAEYGVYGRS